MSAPDLSDWENKLQDYIDNLPPMTRAEVRAELWSYLMTILRGTSPETLHKLLSIGQPVGSN